MSTRERRSFLTRELIQAEHFLELVANWYSLMKSPVTAKLKQITRTAPGGAKRRKFILLDLADAGKQ